LAVPPRCENREKFFFVTHCSLLGVTSVSLFLNFPFLSFRLWLRSRAELSFSLPMISRFFALILVPPELPSLSSPSRCWCFELVRQYVCKTTTLDNHKSLFFDDETVLPCFDLPPSILSSLTPPLPICPPAGDDGAHRFSW